MIKLALFDLGETLIHDGLPFPHAVAALEAISQFTTTTGDALVLGLVSDYLMPTLPATETKIKAKEAEYQGILAAAGLEGFFEPFKSRVTISSRAGVNKPDRRIFKMALERSGTGATFGECLFVTEHTGHLSKCQEYGMVPIHFGTGSGQEHSFVDWADAPALIAELVNPEGAENLAAAVRVTLAAKHGLADFTLQDMQGRREARGHARQLVRLSDPRLGTLDGVHVELPADVTVELGDDGRVTHVAVSLPESEDVESAIDYVSSLVKGRRIAMPGQASVGATHALEQDESGRKRLVRRGYSAR